MYDKLYTKLTEKVPYKALIVVPLVIALLLLPVMFMKPIALGIDFQGGTWIEIPITHKIDQAALERDLESLNLEDLKILQGSDILIIETTTVIAKEDIIPILGEHVGELMESETVRVELPENLSADEKTNLTQKIMNREDIGAIDNISFEGKTMIIKVANLNEDVLKRALDYYLDANVVLEHSETRTLLFTRVEPTMGEDFKTQGMKAMVVAVILMAWVVFFAFRDPIPSLAILLAAGFDILLAVEGMSLLGIKLEPASLAALLMLIGYSVDSDILLTSRTLRRKVGTVNERMDDAMKTGLTMTLTTLVALAALFIVSSIFQVLPLKAVASVLLLGLAADLITTWFMNAGILKWYLEKPRERKKRKKFKFSIFRN